MKQFPSSSSLTRRDFVKTVGAAALLSRTAWARTAPSNRITIGVIGWGMMGPANTKAFLALDDCQVVAACDLHTAHLQAAVDTVNAKYGNTDCKAYHDYREMIARDDIDAIMIAVPDHWHAIIATEAAARKKDIYGEKPLARTIAEQQAIVRAAQKHNIIWQTGSWQRSLPSFHKAAEIVRNGLIGTVTHVEVGLPGAPHDFPNTVPALLEKLSVLPGKITSPAEILPGTPAWDMAVTPPPPELDYDTLARPFKNGALHRRPRLPELAVELQHRRRPTPRLDRPPRRHRPLGPRLRPRPDPLKSKATASFRPPTPSGTPPLKYNVECTYRKEVTGYPIDVNLTIAGGSPAISMGTKWIGTDGWVWVDRSGFDASNPDWVKIESLPDNLRKIKLYESVEHRRNFLDCVKSRKPTIAPVEVAHHSLIPGHLGLISMLVGRKLDWDVKQERILNDPKPAPCCRAPTATPTAWAEVFSQLNRRPASP